MPDLIPLSVTRRHLYQRTVTCTTYACPACETGEIEVLDCRVDGTRYRDAFDLDPQTMPCPRCGCDDPEDGTDA